MIFRQGNILVGTKSGDIYDITEKTSASQVVVNSHTEGEIWGLSTHPEKDVFVTGSDDKTVRLWDLTKKVCRNYFGPFDFSLGFTIIPYSCRLISFFVTFLEILSFLN